MDALDQANPFTEAVEHWLVKQAMPTDKSSAEIKDIDAGVRRQSLFSARTLDEHYLDEISDVVESVLQPQTIQRPDRITASNPQGNVNVGLNPAYARQALKEALKKNGYVPAAGERGTIKDLSSDQRLNLVIKTNVDLSQGAGQFVKQNTNPDRVQDYPALELYRLEDKKLPRDWQTRWMAAAQDSGDTDAAACLANNGRMVALKSSGIWDSLGAGAGGYDDTLGNPYPPFAFNSGMWTMDVARADAVDLGLLDENEEAKPATFDFASLFGIPAAIVANEAVLNRLTRAIIFNSFNDDEARDNDGKWTSGGGSLPAAPKASQEAVDQKQAPVIAKLAAQKGQTPDQFKVSAEKILAKATAKAKVYTRVASGDLGKILDDGRLESEFETGTSRGNFNIALRTQREMQTLGVPLDTKPTDRPIYAYASEKTPSNDSLDGKPSAHINTNPYGDTILEFKDSVKDRSTVGFADTLGATGDIVASPYSSPSIRSVPMSGFNYRLNSDKHHGVPPVLAAKSVDNESTYAEVQIHGRAPVSDIAKAWFTDQPDAELQNKLQAKGIPWQLMPKRQ